MGDGLAQSPLLLVRELILKSTFWIGHPKQCALGQWVLYKMFYATHVNLCIKWKVYT